MQSTQLFLPALIGLVIGVAAIIGFFRIVSDVRKIREHFDREDQAKVPVRPPAVPVRPPAPPRHA